MSEIITAPAEAFYRLPSTPQPDIEPTEFLNPPTSEIGNFVNDTSFEIIFEQILPTGETKKTQITLPHGYNVRGMDSI